jgi:hypothetical protein
VDSYELLLASRLRHIFGEDVEVVVSPVGATGPDVSDVGTVVYVDFKTINPNFILDFTKVQF